MTLEILAPLSARFRRLRVLPLLSAVLLLLLPACNMMQGLLVNGDADDEKMQRIARDVMAAQTLRLMAQSTKAELASQKLGARVNALEAVGDGKQRSVNDEFTKLRQQLDAVAAASGQQKAAEKDIKELRHALRALKTEISQNAEHNRLATASSRARFERLEHRTSKLKFPPASGVKGVHLASYRSIEDARKGWTLLRNKYNIALGGLVPHYIDVDTVSGPFIRLMVGLGFPQGELNAIITDVRAGGDYSMVMPLPDGAAVTSRAPTS